MLQSMASQRVEHDWVTELNWTVRSKDLIQTYSKDNTPFTVKQEVICYLFILWLFSIWRQERDIVQQWYKWSFKYVLKVYFVKKKKKKNEVNMNVDIKWYALILIVIQEACIILQYIMPFKASQVPCHSEVTETRVILKPKTTSDLWEWDISAS